MPELKPLPCPHCGSTWVMASTSPSGADIVQCCNCYMHGPLCDTEEYAIERWNTIPRMSTLIAWQFQTGGAALENQRLRAVLKSVEEIVLDAPELNMSNFDEDQVSSLNEAMISICGILLQESARKDQGMRHGR